MRIRIIFIKKCESLTKIYIFVMHVTKLLRRDLICKKEYLLKEVNIVMNFEYLNTLISDY